MRYVDNPLDNSRYFADGNSPFGMILGAYNVKIANLIEDVPPWAISTNYDVDAKSDEAADQYLAKLDHDDALAEKRHMLQLLLADRFHLRIHSEKRVSTTYELVATSRTPKLMLPVKGDVAKTVSSCNIRYVRQGTEVHSVGCPFPILLSRLQQTLGTDIVDHTGMSGMYAYQLLQSDEGGTMPDGEERYPATIDAVRDQLGLELKRTKGPVTYWVIDHLERPTSN